MLPVATNMLPRHRQRQVLATRFLVSALVASLPLLYVSLLRPLPAALAGDTAFWFLMSNCIVGALFFGGSSSSSSSKADDSSRPSSCCHDDSSFYLSYYDVSGTGQAAAVACSCFKEEASTMTSSSSSSIVDDGGGAWPLFLPQAHASSVLRRDEEDEVAIHPPSTDKNSDDVVLKKAGQGADDDLAMIEVVDRPLLPGPAEPEPPGLVEEEEEIHEAWAIAQRRSRTPDHLEHGKAAAGSREKGKLLRRSATEGSKPAPAAEESDEYWELISDEELNRRVEEFIARFKTEMRRQTEQEDLISSSST